MGFWQIPVPRQVGLGSFLSEKWGVGPSGASAGRHDGGGLAMHVRNWWGGENVKIGPRRKMSPPQERKSIIICLHMTGPRMPSCLSCDFCGFACPGNPAPGEVWDKKLAACSPGREAKITNESTGKRSPGSLFAMDFRWVNYLAYKIHMSWHLSSPLGVLGETIDRQLYRIFFRNFGLECNP